MTENLDQNTALEPRSGRLAIFGLAEKDRIGGSLDYQHHIIKGLSTFAQGWAGIERDEYDRWRTGYGAFAGLRYSW